MLCRDVVKIQLCKALSDSRSTESRNQCLFVLRVALGGLGFISQSSVLDSIKGAFVIRQHSSFSAWPHFPLQNDLLGKLHMHVSIPRCWVVGMGHSLIRLCGSCKWLSSRINADAPHQSQRHFLHENWFPPNEALLWKPVSHFLPLKGQ